MDPIPDRILSDIIDHTVDLHRYEAGLQKSIRAMLQKLTKDLAKEMAESGIDTARTDWQRSRLTSLLKQATGLIDDGYDGIENLITEELGGMIEVTSEAVISACNAAIGAELMLPVKWTQEMLHKLVDGTLIEGAPSSEWWSRQADDLKQAFADQMRQGMLRGENLTQLRDRIMGQDIPGVNAVGKVDLRTVPKENRGLYWKARRNAETLVRSTVISTANAAHHAAYEANADIMAGEAWSACLDLRTCLVAGTPVSTPTGTTPIDKLKSGDFVIGGSGKPRRVLGVMNRRTIRTVKVTLSNGETIRCTEDHLWLNFDQKWVEAKDLKPGYILAFALK